MLNELLISLLTENILAPRQLGSFQLPWSQNIYCLPSVYLPLVNQPNCFFFFVFFCTFRYMTAYTDSDEEELSDAEEGDDEEPANKLAVFLNKIDSLHHGTQSEKQEGLSILLEQKEKVY